MKAFHGNEKLKQKYLSQIRRHGTTEEMWHGIYSYNDGHDCFSGCIIHKCDDATPEKVGIPQGLFWLHHSLFKELWRDDVAETMMNWPGRFFRSIKTGSELSKVFPFFMCWFLIDKNDGIINYAASSKQKKGIEKVFNLYRKILSGKEITADEWQAANEETGLYLDPDCRDVITSFDHLILSERPLNQSSGLFQDWGHKKARDKLIELIEEAGE